MIKTLPDSLLPGATLAHVNSTVIAARRREVDQTRFVVLALRVEGCASDSKAEYVVWEAEAGREDLVDSGGVHLYWGGYYPVEYIESLARATAAYHNRIGAESFALLADEIRDMGV